MRIDKDAPLTDEEILDRKLEFDELIENVHHISHDINNKKEEL